MRQTALYDSAVAAGATMGTVGGWTIATRFSGPTGNSDAFVLVDTSHNGRITIDGDRAAEMLGTVNLAIGASASVAMGQLYRLRRDQFLLLTPPDEQGKALDGLATAATDHGLITITDVTHGRAELTLAGNGVAQTLSRLCGLDFHPSAFTNGQAKQSSVAKTRQLIVRQDINGRTAFKLIGNRSLAQYLWETILEAGSNLGLQSAGLDALSS